MFWFVHCGPPTICNSDAIFIFHLVSKILYDDGDVEVLLLKKERWELVDKGGKSAKVSDFILSFLLFLD